MNPELELQPKENIEDTDLQIDGIEAEAGTEGFVPVEVEEPEEAAEPDAPEAAAEPEPAEEPAPVKKKEKRSRRRKKEVKLTEDSEPLDLSRLKKKELLSIMLSQGEEIDRLRARVSELEAELEDRDLNLSKVGSIAEASLAVTKIFEEADRAAKIYLYNIRRHYEE